MIPNLEELPSFWEPWLKPTSPKLSPTAQQLHIFYACELNNVGKMRTSSINNHGLAWWWRPKLFSGMRWSARWWRSGPRWASTASAMSSASGWSSGAAGSAAPARPTLSSTATRGSGPTTTSTPTAGPRRAGSPPPWSSTRSESLKLNTSRHRTYNSAFVLSVFYF